MTQVTVVSYISFLRGVVNGLEVQRAYTPISPGNAEGYFEVLIKVSQSIQYRLESEVLGTVFSFRNQAYCQHFKGGTVKSLVDSFSVVLKQFLLQKTLLIETAAFFSSTKLEVEEGDTQTSASQHNLC